jgi:hypothetical protein
MSLYTAAAHAERGDVTAAVANMARAVITEAQALLAERRRWVLNEKGIVERAGLGDADDVLLDPGGTPEELRVSVDRIAAIMRIDRPDIR